MKETEGIVEGTKMAITGMPGDVQLAISAGVAEAIRDMAPDVIRAVRDAATDAIYDSADAAEAIRTGTIDAIRRIVQDNRQSSPAQLLGAITDGAREALENYLELVQPNLITDDE